MSQREAVHDRVNRYACMTVEQMMRELALDSKGLTERQAAVRRKRYGSNAPAAHKQDSVRHCLRRAFVNPFSVILFVLGWLSFGTDVLLPETYQKSFSTVWIIFFMLVISGAVRLVQELRAREVAEKLERMVHTTVQVWRDDTWTECSSELLVVGDRVRVEAGDRVPADLRVIEASDLFVSQSVITGESMVLEKTPERLPNQPNTLNGYDNILFGGTTVAGGSGTGIVLAVGQQTVYGGLSPQLGARRQGFERGAHAIAGVLIRFMAVLTPVVFLASGLTKRNWGEAFLFALSVAVGLTPELLPMVVNACLAKGSASMGRKQTIVKNINAMQGFGSMDTLCVDKTGTLTDDTLQPEYYMDILGNECRKTLDYAYLASRYHTGVGNQIDTALCRAAEMPGQEQYYLDLERLCPKLDERPFDYTRGVSSVLLKENGQNLLILKGGVDQVVGRCNRAEYKGKITPAETDVLFSAHAVVDEMLEDGMKVIAVAYKPVQETVLSDQLEEDCILLGYIAFFDAPRQSAASAIGKLQALHVKVKVLTGDQKPVALSICRRLGIDDEFCLTGRELEELTEDDLPTALEKTAIFAELSPRQKARVVENLQGNGHVVGFLGDGMNDLPAMLQADVGISVENATDAVRESASVILLKKDLNVLEEGILEGRKAFANMIKYIKITASSNFGNICAIVAASVLLPFFPMTSVQLLLLNLLYDLLCLVLPWDRVDKELTEQPLEWSGRTLGRFMRFFGPISSVFDFVTFWFLYFVLCPGVCGGQFAALTAEGRAQFIAIFQTGWFLESLWTQVLILQLLRTPKLPFLQSRPGGMVVAVTVPGVILFTLLPVTSLGSMLGMAPMPWRYFAFLAVVVAAYLLLVSLAKGWYVKRQRQLL